MNAKFTRTARLLGTCFAAFTAFAPVAAHATVQPTAHATADPAVAFARMLNHQDITARPAQQNPSREASGTTSAPDPLLEHLVAALRPEAK